jgi:hypothetical protein
MPPSGFAVEEIYAADYPVIAAQVYGPRLAAGGDVVAELDLFTCTVSVTDHHALELDRSAKDAKLNAPKSAFRSAYRDCVTIPLAVHCGLSEQDPGSGPRNEFISVERHPRSRAMPPSGFAVEEIDAADHPVVTAQVYGPRLAAGGDVVTELDLFAGPVRETNHHALELDRGARDAKLNASKCPFRSAYRDCVTIPLAVHRRLSE